MIQRTDAPEVPEIIRLHREALAGSGAEITLRGVTEGWVAPVVVYDAPTGFAEEAWVKDQPDTVLAWTIAGADVTCEFGKWRGRSVKAWRPAVTLKPASTPNEYRARGQIRFGQFVITDALLRVVAEGLGMSRSDHTILRDDLIFGNDPELKRSLKEYADRSVDPISPPSRVEMEARAILIVERLLSVHHLDRHRPQSGGLAPIALKRVADYMLTHLGEEIPMIDLATIARLAPHHFCRAFKQSTGLPPHAWLVARRIERAQEMMLGHPDKGLIEIALAVGYQSHAAFGAAFRRATGVSPGQWRRERLR